MNGWEKKITDAFIKCYLLRSSKSLPDPYTPFPAIRIRSQSVFPDFDASPPDEKESYLEAAESFERRGLIRLAWEKRARGEHLKSLICEDIGKLFEAAGRKDPVFKVYKMRSLFSAKGLARRDEFLLYLSEQIKVSGVGRGIDVGEAEDFLRLVEMFQDGEKPENITTRALSVLLFNDSKRLERLLELFKIHIADAQREGISPPPFALLERSFPETMIAGKIIFEFNQDGNNSRPPLVNGAGLRLGLPLPSVSEISRVIALEAKESPAVLTIENKETFYALTEPRNSNARWDCFLYTGGYPNQAVAALIRVLAASGFCFHHSGDLDPDGILILQNIMDLADRPVSPVCMDERTFDRYLPLARPLAKTMLSQIERIRGDTLAIPELAGLLCRIEETSRGVEQEIIDYRS